MSDKIFWHYLEELPEDIIRSLILFISGSRMN